MFTTFKKKLHKQTLSVKQKQPKDVNKNKLTFANAVGIFYEISNDAQ